MQACSKLHLAESIAQNTQYCMTGFASKAVKIFVIHHLDVWSNVAKDFQKLFKSCTCFFTASQGERWWNITFANSTVNGMTSRIGYFLQEDNEVHHATKYINF